MRRKYADMGKAKFRINKNWQHMKSYGYEITEEKPIWYVIEKELRGEVYVLCIDHIKSV